MIRRVSTGESCLGCGEVWDACPLSCGDGLRGHASYCRGSVAARSVPKRYCQTATGAVQHQLRKGHLVGGGTELSVVGVTGRVFFENHAACIGYATDVATACRRTRRQRQATLRLPFAVRKGTKASRPPPRGVPKVHKRWAYPHVLALGWSGREASTALCTIPRSARFAVVTRGVPRSSRRARSSRHCFCS
jgi:hypothetical protein